MSAQLLVEEFLGLADLIAFDYRNIPGIDGDDALSEARMALIRAVEAFDPARGEFPPFASRVIRNSLNSLYATQLRMARLFTHSLDQMPQEEMGRIGASADADTVDSKQDVLAEMAELAKPSQPPLFLSMNPGGSRSQG